ncbi:hypothetical protein ACFJIX_20650 [Roseateles sp. UC29_93]|uniref:hypothetical protein n=1 Tax=Roseateles sp. UC29_93 TaxID=3350177 RepID=UPI00366B766E
MVSVKRKNAAALAALSVIVAACGGGGSDDGPAPVIATQPMNATVLTDGTTMFTVVATGSGLGYQWQKNGVAIAGATSASYQTPAVTSADSGAKYTVVVTNSSGSVTSSAAQLTLQLSANQQAFENLILAPSAGSYFLHWNLNYSGPQINVTNYAYSDFGVLTASPLTNGPQINAQSAPHNITSTLALPSPGPTRVLKNRRRSRRAGYRRVEQGELREQRRARRLARRGQHHGGVLGDPQQLRDRAADRHHRRDTG